MNNQKNNRISNVEKAIEITVIRVVSTFGRETKEYQKHYVYQHFYKQGNLLASYLSH